MDHSVHVYMSAGKLQVNWASGAGGVRLTHAGLSDTSAIDDTHWMLTSVVRCPAGASAIRCPAEQ